MAGIDASDSQTGTSTDPGGQIEGQDGVPLVFMRESAIFGQRKPSPEEWLKHTELYSSIGNVIDCSHITGLQRVNGLWRIYVDNINVKVALMAQGVPLRGKTVPVLRTNPNRLDSENTTRIRVKNIPLSVDDDSITRQLTLKGIDIISVYREKLRVNGKLTNCATGDRLFIARSTSFKEPLPMFMAFGRFKGRILHFGQAKDKWARTSEVKCSKCLEDGHRFAQCTNEWKCTACNQSGHKKADCTHEEDPIEDPISSESGESSESDEGETDDVTLQTTTAVQTEIHEEPRNPVDATPSRRKKPAKKSAKKSSAQQTLTSFVEKNNGSHLTPAKEKRDPVVNRSPPTPAEQLHDNSKKTKGNR